MAQHFESCLNWIRVSTLSSRQRSAKTTLSSSHTVPPEIRSGSKGDSRLHYVLKAFSLPMPKSITCSATRVPVQLHGYVAATGRIVSAYGPSCRSLFPKGLPNQWPQQVLTAQRRSTLNKLTQPQRYYPIEFEPYTPAHWFERKDKDPKFRTKPKIARILVKQAQAANIPFRAVVADSFYGENDAFRDGLANDGIPFVLALYPSHTWWHKVGAIGSAQEIAQAASWREDDPGKWQRLERTFRDRHKEIWWVLEGEAGPYGVNKPQRLIIATTDPEQLPNLTTWYLTTNLPAPDSQHTEEGEIEAANAEDIVKLYGLRIWVEQSYKQVKQHLGWAEYQVCSDLAMRRHWQLVCCAFSFCWWEQTYAPETTDTQEPENEPTSNAAGGDPQPDKKKPCCTAAVAELARSVEKGSGVSRTLPHALALLARVVAEAPAA